MSISYSIQTVLSFALCLPADVHQAASIHLSLLLEAAEIAEYMRTNHNLYYLKLWPVAFCAYVSKFRFYSAHLSCTGARQCVKSCSQCFCLCYIVFFFQVKFPRFGEPTLKIKRTASSSCNEVTRGRCVKEYLELLCWHCLGRCQAAILTLYSDLSLTTFLQLFWLQQNASKANLVCHQIFNSWAYTFECLCLYKYMHSWHRTHTLVPFLAFLSDSPPQLCKQLRLSHLIDSRFPPHPFTLWASSSLLSLLPLVLSVFVGLLGLSAWRLSIQLGRQNTGWILYPLDFLQAWLLLLSGLNW